MAEDTDSMPTLVIIGNGMTSHRLCQKLVDNGVHESIRIVVFGEERFPAYDRTRLTSLLAGQDGESLLLAKEDWYESHGINLYLDDPIVHVDREQSVITSYSGRRVPYDRLVFATGSEPVIPPIEGLRVTHEDGSKQLRRGVFVYRTFDDAYNIEAILEGSLRIAIIGGGPPGLEAAKAVHLLSQRMHPIDVCIIEAAPGLMPNHLDAPAAALLKEKIEELGIKVWLGQEITRIRSFSRTGAAPEDDDEERLVVHVESGSALPVDTIILSAGNVPRTELAKAAGIACAPNGGIVVDDRLQTSDEQIFAIGECASHNGATYDRVTPGYEMADVLVENLLGGNSRFNGADPSMSFNFLGVPVTLLGEYGGDTKPLSSALRYTTGGIYRKLVTRQGRLIGAVAIGHWENLYRIREAVRSPAPLSFWDMRRFRSTGMLFPKDENKNNSLDLARGDSNTLICGCKGITLGALGRAIAEGFTTAEALERVTGAGSVCGSCRPLLQRLADAPLSIQQRERPIISLAPVRDRRFDPLRRTLPLPMLDRPPAGITTRELISNAPPAAPEPVERYPLPAALLERSTPPGEQRSLPLLDVADSLASVVATSFESEIPLSKK